MVPVFLGGRSGVDKIGRTDSPYPRLSKTLQVHFYSSPVNLCLLRGYTESYCWSRKGDNEPVSRRNTVNSSNGNIYRSDAHILIRSHTKHPPHKLCPTRQRAGSVGGRMSGSESVWTGELRVGSDDSVVRGSHWRPGVRVGRVLHRELRLPFRKEWADTLVGSHDRRGDYERRVGGVEWVSGRRWREGSEG